MSDYEWAESERPVSEPADPDLSEPEPELKHIPLLNITTYEAKNILLIQLKQYLTDENLRKIWEIIYGPAMLIDDGDGGHMLVFEAGQAEQFLRMIIYHMQKMEAEKYG